MDFFKIIAHEIDHSYESGIGSEINSFLEYNKIKDFILTFDQEKEIFLLVINVSEKDSIEIQQLFKEMILFLEFPCATFYTTKLSDSKIVYNFISYSEQNRGFILNVTFNFS